MISENALMKNREDQRNKTKVDNLLTFMVKILFLGNFPEYDVSLY